VGSENRLGVAVASIFCAIGDYTAFNGSIGLNGETHWPTFSRKPANQKWEERRSQLVENEVSFSNAVKCGEVWLCGVFKSLIGWWTRKESNLQPVG
jgi:hypothetical protein